MASKERINCSRTEHNIFLEKKAYPSAATDKLGIYHCIFWALEFLRLFVAFSG